MMQLKSSGAPLSFENACLCQNSVVMSSSSCPRPGVAENSESRSQSEYHQPDEMLAGSTTDTTGLSSVMSWTKRDQRALGEAYEGRPGCPRHE